MKSSNPSLRLSAASLRASCALSISPFSSLLRLLELELLDEFGGVEGFAVGSAVEGRAELISRSLIVCPDFSFLGSVMPLSHFKSATDTPLLSDIPESVSFFPTVCSFFSDKSPSLELFWGLESVEVFCLAFVGGNFKKSFGRIL